VFFVSLTNSEKLWALIPTQVEIDLSEQVNVFSLDKTARLLYHNALNIIAWLSSNKADSYCLTNSNLSNKQISYFTIDISYCS